MKILLISSAAIAGALLTSQETPPADAPARPATDTGKTVVEFPVKKRVLVARAPDGGDNSKYAALGLRAAEEVYPVAADPPPGAKYDLAKTGIDWHRGIDAVVNRGKPILLLQILGNFDDVYC